jgi:RNA polymerase-binding transcription factor
VAGWPAKPKHDPGIALGTHAKKLEELDRLLTGKIAEASARIETLTRTFDDIVRSSEGSPPDDEHDPDGATSGFERAQIAALLASVRSERAELERAVDRMRRGTYGICESCGKEIVFERLRARPGVRTCVRCAPRSRSR